MDRVWRDGERWKLRWAGEEDMVIWVDDGSKTDKARRRRRSRVK